MLADFISPARVARTIAHQARVAFRKRLQLLELLVLKLLLIEATRVPAVSCKPMTTGSQPYRRLPAGSTDTRGAHACGFEEHPDHPITWRVCFHTPGRRRNTRAPTHRAPPRAPACAHTLALKLARRFEALRRVIADPRRAIAALVRKLTALGAGARTFARAIALASPRQGGGPIFADATVRAHDATFALPCDTT
jgi:hypothetical protein